MKENMNDTIQKLEKKGVIVIDPRQTFISPDVDMNRIFEGSILFPGVRLTGARTLVGSFAKIGTEGPATIQNSIIGSYSEVASGFLSESTLLPKARAGANSHYRAGTLLEEESSTAHSVGLKQSILMYGVTLGSLINFCDILISGGRSRSEHTEVGSGFIHFNYTPWGQNGDKATPSLVGNVSRGVFLDQDRIFLGGLSGMIGPNTVDFGALTIAGQVIRKPVAETTIHSEVNSEIDKSWSPSKVNNARLESVRSKNIEFISQLYALKKWYVQIRLKRSNLQKNLELSLVIIGAIETIQCCINERVKRYNDFSAEWNQPPVDMKCLDEDAMSEELTLNWRLEMGYYEWVKGFSEKEKFDLHKWLNDMVQKSKEAMHY